MLQYETIPVTPFQQNCSVVWCDETMRGAIIDPGGDLDMLLDGCKQLGVTLEQIWITHAHIDHAGGTSELAERLKLPIIGPHEDDQFWIDCLAQAAASYGFPPSRAFTPTRWLHDGDTVTLGQQTFHAATTKT
jgi:hydroxyacylglutathione hydrolase